MDDVNTSAGETGLNVADSAAIGASEIFPLLVSGGGGRMVPIVIQELLQRGVRPEQLIVSTRTPEKLADLASQGADIRYVDFFKPESLRAAFAGAKRALFTSIRPPVSPKPGEDIFKPGTRTWKDEYSVKPQMRAVVDAAVAAGVEHLFFTSSLGADPGSPAAWADEVRAVEKMIQESGKTWTIMRHGRQPDLALSGLWITALENGEFFDANAGGRHAWVTRADTAASDAGALLSPSSLVANKLFNISGPQALTTEEIMADLSEAAGKPIKVIPVGLDELGEKLVGAGALPELVPVFTMWAETTKAGYFALQTDHAEKFAGRPLTTLREYFVQALPQLPEIVDGMRKRMMSYGQLSEKR